MSLSMGDFSTSPAPLGIGHNPPPGPPLGPRDPFLKNLVRELSAHKATLPRHFGNLPTTVLKRFHLPLFVEETENLCQALSVVTY